MLSFQIGAPSCIFPHPAERIHMTHISGAADWAPAHYKYDTRKSSGSGPDIWDASPPAPLLSALPQYPLAAADSARNSSAPEGSWSLYQILPHFPRHGPRNPSAGADHLNVLARQLPDRPVQHFFNCHTIRLDLPAAIIRAVIGNGQSDSFIFNSPVLKYPDMERNIASDHKHCDHIYHNHHIRHKIPGMIPEGFIFVRPSPP